VKDSGEYVLNPSIELKCTCRIRKPGASLIRHEVRMEMGECLLYRGTETSHHVPIDFVGKID
jgi:hypothetical protein